mmetsp:Transcript_47101/g.102461  ORF Transcript_47101/g.102461 Transcript_47101/m.102461 type:complete len:90 (-) Transcript_47101:122-391(-)
MPRFALSGDPNASPAKLRCGGQPMLSGGASGPTRVSPQPNPVTLSSCKLGVCHRVGLELRPGRVSVAELGFCPGREAATNQPYGAASGP